MKIKSKDITNWLNVTVPQIPNILIASSAPLLGIAAIIAALQGAFLGAGVVTLGSLLTGYRCHIYFDNRTGDRTHQH